jgi:hypothetical protein
MTTLGSYAELEMQKDMVTQLLVQAFPFVPREEHEAVTEEVLKKISFLNKLRANIAESDAANIELVAKQYDADPDSVLDSFIYFYVVTEAAWLTKLLTDLKKPPPKQGE